MALCSNGGLFGRPYGLRTHPDLVSRELRLTSDLLSKFSSGVWLWMMKCNWISDCLVQRPTSTASKTPWLASLRSTSLPTSASVDLLLPSVPFLPWYGGCSRDTGGRIWHKIRRYQCCEILTWTESIGFIIGNGVLHSHLDSIREPLGGN
jgi:hypothetical protein